MNNEVVQKTYRGSFIRRILLICFFFIVVPLIAYSALVWSRNWQIKLNSIFLELELKAESSLSLYNQWRMLRFYQLDQFTKTIEDDSVSGKFIFDRNFKCTFSTFKEMEGKSDFFPKILQQAYQKGALIFVGQNPYTGQKEIVVLKRKGDAIRGLSVNAAKWLRHFGPHRHFEFSLIESDQELHEKTFTLAQLIALKERLNFFKAYSLRNQSFVLLLQLPDALFNLKMELPENTIAQMEGGRLFHDVLVFLLLILLFGGIGTWWLVRKMARPFNQLAEVMHAVSQKDYSKRYHSGRFGFEINALGANFNQMLQTLLENMENAKNEKVARELLSQELQIGRELQNELLPKEIPQFPGLEFGMGFSPAKEVAGDFYDVFAKDSDQLMLAIADGSGKGISACLYSLIMRSILRSYAQSEEDLSKVVLHANNLFCKDTRDTGNFVTSWIGFYHVKDRSLSYTSAGHLPGILLQPNGEIEELTTEGIALGATFLQSVNLRKVYLSPGSLLILYTDGIVEAHNEKGELFGKSRLYQFLKNSRSLRPQELVDQLLKEIHQFADRMLQHDDVTLLCTKIS